MQKLPCKTGLDLGWMGSQVEGARCLVSKFMNLFDTTLQVQVRTVHWTLLKKKETDASLPLPSTNSPPAGHSRPILTVALGPNLRKPRPAPIHSFTHRPQFCGCKKNISFVASGSGWGRFLNGRTLLHWWSGGVCLLSMASSTAAAALLRPCPGVPAAVNPYRWEPESSCTSTPHEFNRLQLRLCRLQLSERRSPRAAAGLTTRRRRRAAGVVRACFTPLGDERILREAIKVNFPWPFSLSTPL
jgi:hypothetical protein